MGFLKKITRPISRALDKLVPNELKPALPFLAAAAPFMAPGLMGIGGNTMFSRALMSGGLNLGAQLAQEGSDGDFSGLSTLMAAATGALSAPGADAKLRGMKFGDSTSTIARTPFGPQVPYGPVDQAGISTLQRGANIGLEGLAKSAQFLGPSEGGVTDILGKGGTEVGFNKATATAAMVPLTQATTDLAVAENRRALKAYEQDLADYEASMGDQATDEGRALAIRTAMLRYGFTEDEITDTISSAGYRAGGRVGYAFGNFVKGSEVAQPVSASMNAGNRPMMSGSGMGGMLSNMINNNPQLFSNLTGQGNNSVSNMSRDFIDLNENGIDDRQEKAIGGRVELKGGGADFGGIPAAIENIQEDAEEMITIMTDNGPIQIEKSVYESMPGMFMDTTTSAYGDAGRGRPVPQFANGGRIGLKNGSDGSSTGSFGTDRYISEMLSEGNTLANRGENFMSEYDEMVKSGKIDSSIFDKLKEYKDMQKTEENLEKKFSNENLENVAEENLDKDALKYYGKKVNKLEKKFDDLNEKEEGIIALEKKTNFDASEITKTPDFQNWLRVYNSEDKMKAFDHPYADIYLSILDVKLKGRNESQRDLVGLADGGLMNLGGKEMDMRGGGFIPIGKKERADDVPARLSKNEFVMTADAVRAAGGGSVNKGAKRMYETMNKLEARA